MAPLDAATGRTSDPIRSCHVALVNMPVASAGYPSLALGTLKSSLLQEGHRCRVHHFNLLFARRIGLDAYEELARAGDVNLGEHAFAQLLYPERGEDPAFISFLDGVIPRERFDALVAEAAAFVQDCADILLEGDPDIIGFTTSFHQTMASLALARELRRRGGEFLIALGGANCELPMGSALAETYPWIDVTFHGDADVSFPSFVSALGREGSDLFAGGGLCFRSGSGIVVVARPASPVEMDRVPMPSFGEYVEQRSALDLAGDWRIPFELSRGCWWGAKNHCTFCGLNGAQMHYRRKSPARARIQLEELAKSFPGGTVQLTDNILDFRIVRDGLSLLKGLAGLRFFCEIKANLTEEQVGELADCGITEIQPGIERFSDPVLAGMRKGTTARQNAQLLRWCADRGVGCVWNLLYGFGGERPEDVDKEIELLRQLFHLQPPSGVGPLRVDRFSPHFDDPARYGLCLAGPMISQRLLFFRESRVDDLAYFFAAEYPDETGHRMAEPWGRLSSIVEEWKKQYRLGLLTQRQDNGGIRILDGRHVPREIELGGSAAEIYEYCSGARNRSVLRERWADADEIIDQLVTLELLIHQDDWVLAAAVRASRNPKFPTTRRTGTD